MTKLFKGFKFAAIGIKRSIISERNLRIHFVAGMFAFTVAPFFLTSRTQWAILALTVAFVVTAELLNTAFERLCDISSPHYSPGAKAAKDIAAGGVLVSAFFSVIVGLCLFLRRAGFEAMLNFCRNNIWYSILLIIMLIFSVLFIIGKRRKKL